MFAHSYLFNGVGRWPGRFVPLHRSIATTYFQLLNKMLNQNWFREGTAHVTSGMHMDYTSSSQFLFQRDQKHKRKKKKKGVC